MRNRSRVATVMSTSSRLRRLSIAALAALLPACGALHPKPLSREERLAAFPQAPMPLAAPVEIRWNEWQVPFIQAQTDRDLAFTLGVVHAHLRGGQMQILKRIAQGRLSESVGPVANDIDHALRILDFGHASEAIQASWSPTTEAWVSAYVDGLNWHLRTTGGKAPEFGLLGIEPEPWDADALLTFGRLAGTDVNWLRWFDLLKQRQQDDWPEVWQRALIAGGAIEPDHRFAADDRGTDELAALLGELSRSGSNSFAIAPARSATGAALIANDPHLGLSLPNFWVLLGVKSPSYHAVGLTIPGLPFIALGRSEHMAWGGTNARAASSDLYDVARLPAQAIETHEETIATRFWRNRTVQVRRTSYGPILSDASYISGRDGEALAVRWVGHEPSDEIGAFLEAAKARTPQEFRDAFATYAVSAQNMIFADHNGNIGRILATRHPIRPFDVPEDLVLEPAQDWQGFRDARDLPMLLNPEDGTIASANEKPEHINDTLGYFFGPGERIERFEEIAAERALFDVASLQALQSDVFAPKARQLAQQLTARIERVDADQGHEAFVARLAGWDGSYAIDSEGAVAFELLLSEIARRLYGRGEDAEVSGIQDGWGYLLTFLLEDLNRTDNAAALLRGAVAAADLKADAYATWGDLHTQRVGLLLAGLPVIGRAFLLDEQPAPGSRETLMKRAHGLLNGREAARYGAQARHISDMSDPNANWFVLYGGQDGWLGSENFADQIALWNDGRYIQMPLEGDAVEAAFPTRMVLRPEG